MKNIKVCIRFYTINIIKKYQNLFSLKLSLVVNCYINVRKLRTIN